MFRVYSNKFNFIYILNNRFIHYLGILNSLLELIFKITECIEYWNHRKFMWINLNLNDYFVKNIESFDTNIDISFWKPLNIV